MKLNLGCGSRKLAGFENLDKETGWLIESGLPYASGSVDAITISHMLLHVPEGKYYDVFLEFHRVLVPGGIVRITEHENQAAGSKWLASPYPWAKTLTGTLMMGEWLHKAMLKPYLVTPETTMYSDNSLIQNNDHGFPPHVFHIEGIK